MTIASHDEAGPCPVCGNKLHESCTSGMLCDACMARIQFSPPPSTESPTLTLEQLQNALPGYAIRELVGRGGHGSVFNAVEKAYDRSVAIKALLIDPDDDDGIQRFEAECEALAQLQHPNIPVLYTSGNVDNIHYAVMEWLPGGNLHQWLLKRKAAAKDGKGKRERKRKAGSLPEIMSIVLQLCDVLIYLHSEGRIHRDVKPENILFKKDGSICLVDFGFSRRLVKRRRPGLTRVGVSIGTPGYRSPEQVDGHQVDERTDIYSFGALVFGLFTLRDPRGTRRPPSTEGYPKAIDAIVDKAMEYDPADRYQDMHSMRRAISRALIAWRIRQVSVYVLASLGIALGAWGMWYWRLSF